MGCAHCALSPIQLRMLTRVSAAGGGRDQRTDTQLPTHHSTHHPTGNEKLKGTLG